MGSSLRRRSALGLAAVAASAAMTGMVRAQNLVSDPSFETSGPAGSFAAGGWTVTTNPNLSGPALRTPGTAGWPVHTGSWAAAYGDPLTAFGQTIEDTLSQSIATVPGTAYTVSFWLDNFGDKPGSTPSGQGFAANFAGGSITTNAVLTAYTQYSFTGTATATATTLNLAGFDYVNAGYYMLDDVSVTPQVTPAGPSTWVNTGSGDWNVATNWTPGIPNGIGAEADFLGAITTTSLVTTSQAETLGTVRFNNSNIYALNGTGSLTLQTSTGSALIDVQAGSHIIGLPLTLASNATFQTDGPATRLILSGPVTLAPGVKVAAAGAGTVTYTSSVTLGSAAAISFATPTAVTALTLGAAATATVSPTTGTRTYLQTSSLSLAATATLDVTDNDLVVHGGSLAAVTAAVAAGYAGGLWTGPGITSSTAAGDAKRLTAVGVLQPSSAATVDGQPVATTDVFAKLTYYGDANLDGVVNGADYARIDAGLLGNGSLTGWQNGDFNYDGKVDAADYTLIDNAFDEQGFALGSGGGSAASVLTAASTDEIAPVLGTATVPEPATAGLLAAVTVGVTARRRRV